MLSDDKRAKFFQLLKESTKEDWLWMSGYISAMVEPMDRESISFIQPSDSPLSAISQAKKQNLACSVVFGTETGNSKKVATSLVKKLKEIGTNAKLKSMETYKIAELDTEEYLFVIVSTHGDGDPPAAAKAFFTALQERKNKFSALKFAVLGLGDTSYPLFCKIGEDVDSMLSALGGVRIFELGKCDVDFDIVATAWIEGLLKTLATNVTSKAQTTNISSASKIKTVSSKKLTYMGNVATNIVLNDIQATKSTRHIEIKTDVSLEYEPGDSAGVIAKNSSSEVEKVLSLLGYGVSDKISYHDENVSVFELLCSKLSIRFLPDRVIKKYAELAGKNISQTRVDLDFLLNEYPLANKAESVKVFEILEPIVPRYYSIASSPAAHGDHEIHLTVAELQIETGTGNKDGLCSGFLSSLGEGAGLEFNIQKNSNFRLPPPDADLIMIGPGTGIAPFRSFLFEREAQSATGKNWLFFGERNFVSDFYYQAELLQMMETGLLQKLNTAFSRDTKHKVYVQDRMMENAVELREWIEKGAYIYVCGSKDPMSKDVEAKLIQVLSERNFSKDKTTEEYLSGLVEEGRYKKDVY